MPRKTISKTKSVKKKVVREARAVYVAQPTSVDIGSLIARNPKIRKGRPCIAGTGVSVRRIAVWHKLGYSPEEIADQFGHISIAQVYAALTYYYANHDEIESDLDAEEALTHELESRHYLAQQKT